MKPGQKFDGGKAPVFEGFLQYFPRAVKAVANISAFGHEKYQVPYEDQNWRRVEKAKARYRNANGRHVTDEQIEGLYAPDSQRLHAAHAAWNAMAYLEFLLTEGIPEEKVDDARGPSQKAR